MPRSRSATDGSPTGTLVDEVALYRLVGSPECMSEQMRHLLTVAALPSVTLQLVPLVAHAANASGLVIAGGAAYCEHIGGGSVYTEPRRVSSLARRLDTLRGECRRVSETAAMIDRMSETWSTGGNPPIPTLAAVSA